MKCSVGPSPTTSEEIEKKSVEGNVHGSLSPILQTDDSSYAVAGNELEKVIFSEKDVYTIPYSYQVIRSP